MSIYNTFTKAYSTVVVSDVPLSCCHSIPVCLLLCPQPVPEEASHCSTSGSPDQPGKHHLGFLSISS